VYEVLCYAVFQNKISVICGDSRFAVVSGDVEPCLRCIRDIPAAFLCGTFQHISRQPMEVAVSVGYHYILCQLCKNSMFRNIKFVARNHTPQLKRCGLHLLLQKFGGQ
jgi:hypothetical protein